jgi:hypothetical protein
MATRRRRRTIDDRDVRAASLVAAYLGPYHPTLEEQHAARLPPPPPASQGIERLDLAGITLPSSPDPVSPEAFVASVFPWEFLDPLRGDITPPPAWWRTMVYLADPLTPPSVRERLLWFLPEQLGATDLRDDRRVSWVRRIRGIVDHAHRVQLLWFDGCPVKDARGRQVRGRYIDFPVNLYVRWFLGRLPKALAGKYTAPVPVRQKSGRLVSRRRRVAAARRTTGTR